jgi:hypothetical protein
MTSMKPHILGIPGSLRQATYSRAVLRGLQEIARELGTETKIPVYGRLLLLRSGEVAPATLHHPARDNQTDGWGHVGPRSRGVRALPRPRRVACPLLSFRVAATGKAIRRNRGKCCPFAAVRVASRDRPVDQLVRDSSPILRF